MRRLLIFLSLLIYSAAVKEEYENIDSIFDNPELLASLEKRLSKILGTEADLENQDDGCYDSSGLIDGTCSFQTNKSTIIKTTESLENGAFFLKNVPNVTCAKDCTKLCCETDACDTSIYQDKDKFNCYLFTCGAPSKCIFANHADYMVSSLSLETHTSHTLGGEPAAASHEDELSNLGGSAEIEIQPAPSTKPPTTTKIPTTTHQPGLGEACVPWTSVCEDPHARCSEQECQCRTGYQAKFGKCSKMCTSKEFECVNEVDRRDALDCIPDSYVCDGTPDCSDGSDEMNCPTDKKDSRPNSKYPFVGKDGSKEEPGASRLPDVPKVPPKQTDTHADSGSSTNDADSSQLPGDQGKSSQDLEDVEPVANKPGPSKVTPTGPETSGYSSKPVEPPREDNSKEGGNSVPVDKPSDSEPSKSSEETKPGDGAGTQSSPSPSLKPVKSDLSDSSSGSKPIKSGGLIGDNIGTVEVFTDSTQGPIVALALGLAITLFLLIFVGCRLRTVKRRLRKGRALHSNEADYLINGMYL